MARTLRINNTGDDVKELQRLLGVTPDGVFGADTAKAVIAFQRKAGIEPDGVVGIGTWLALTGPTAKENPHEFHTAGPLPEHDEPEIDDNGVYSRARFVTADAGRVGAKITPWSFVVHTTDMMPRSFNGLIKTWSSSAGSGAAAHVIIGRDASQGVVQMVACNRNGNHAGGAKVVDRGTPNCRTIPFHGWYAVDGKHVHPNLVTVGVEVHAGGYLGPQVKGQFIHPDTHEVVPPEDVFVDERGIGWHRITQYQLEELGHLADAFERRFGPPPANVTIEPNGTYAENGAKWAQMDGVRMVGHVTLDPANKTDPGPQLIEWIRTRAHR